MERAGQTLLEFALSVAGLAAVFAGTAVLGRAEWNRMRCAQLAFEQAHLARIGSPARLPRVSVFVEPIAGGFRARARCGEINETVELPELEAARW